jgi:predicted RNA polymerase sigma factor
LVHRVATNACTDELRRRQRRIKREAAPKSEEDDVILRIPDSNAARQPELALEIDRKRRLIWEVSKKLPQRQRTVLALRELQLMSYASIARFMNISESAVETLLHRARRRFREEFLMLEGPREDEGICSTVMRLLATVGRDKLQSAQRCMVDEHLQVCSWCRENSKISSVREDEVEKVRIADG